MRRRTILPAAALLVGALVAVGSTDDPIVEAADPVDGFVDASLGSFSSPTAVEWLPGNRIVVLEKGGRVRVGRPGGAFTTAIDLAVCTESERGLLGLTPDPGFLGNGWVYVYYTHPGPNGCVNRVSRLTMAGDRISLASEFVLLDNIASTGGNHNGGDLDVDSNGYLFVSIGDSGADPRGDSGSAGGNDAAQDLSLLNGKILRLTRLGAPAPGNPFSGSGTIRCGSLGTSAPTSVKCQEIFAYGLRNPYRFAFDRDAGGRQYGPWGDIDTFYINDVGQRTYEEVNRGLTAENYGWPTYEGNCRQGETEPCDALPDHVLPPITTYGRDRGTYVTAGAFVPDGLWAERYDGTYLFADGGSGQIWLMDDDGSVDYDAPFATGAFGITDMTFGFDTQGRMVLYYVQVGGSLGAIAPGPEPVPTPSADLKMRPIVPVRAYDTGDGTGVTDEAAGDVVNATTRVIGLNPPAGTAAALVNITMAQTDGPGFVRTWATRGLRPVTSSVNAGGANSTVGNAVIVPVAGDGTFILEASTTARVVVDVMAWFSPTTGTSTDGRFVAQDPARLIDTREPEGATLPSGSTNPYARAGDRIGIEVAGHLDIPDDGTAGAVVLSVAAIPTEGLQGRATLYPSGAAEPATSSVNVTPGDIRNNLVVVSLDGGPTNIVADTKNLDHLVIDVLGYVTTSLSPAARTGLYQTIAPTRLVDTRTNSPFARLSAGSPSLLAVPDSAAASAIAQTVTVVRPAGPGWIVAHPSVDPPIVSNLNYRPGETRGTLAFTRITERGGERFTALVATDLVVDQVGFFSK